MMLLYMYDDSLSIRERLQIFPPSLVESNKLAAPETFPVLFSVKGP